MSVANFQGARIDIPTSPPNGVNTDVGVKDGNGAAISLAGTTITGYLMDDDGSAVTPYTMTVVSEAGGTFDLVFPASAFTNLWGEEISYTVNMQFSGDAAPTPLLYGVIRLQEAR